MPIFGGNRDVGFLKGIQKELMHQLISVEVLIYKISNEHTKVNIYSEATDRIYKPDVKLFANISAEDKIAQSDNDIIDFNKNIIFSFLKVDLKNSNLVLEEGDIIMYDDSYFEIDNVNSGNYWTNRNPNTNIGMTQNNWPLHGYDHTIIVETHLTRREVLNIEEDTRTGNNVEDFITPSIVKFI